MAAFLTNNNYDCIYLFYHQGKWCRGERFISLTTGHKTFAYDGERHINGKPAIVHADGNVVSFSGDKLWINGVDVLDVKEGMSELFAPITSLTATWMDSITTLLNSKFQPQPTAAH
jgi:hypothetical protein